MFFHVLLKKNGFMRLYIACSPTRSGSAATQADVKKEDGDPATRHKQSVSSTQALQMAHMSKTILLAQSTGRRGFSAELEKCTMCC